MSLKTMPETQVVLLDRVRNKQDSRSWRNFVEMYTPVIHGYCRRRGLQDADATDVTQEVWQAVAVAIQRFDYDCGRGSFRGWLMTVVRSKICNFIARKARDLQGSGDTSVREIIAAQPGRQERSEPCRDDRWRSVLTVMEMVRSQFREATWHAFWQTAVEGRPAKAVAQALGMTAGAVYIARSRVLKTLRERIGELEAC